MLILIFNYFIILIIFLIILKILVEFYFLLNSSKLVFFKHILQVLPLIKDFIIDYFYFFFPYLPFKIFIPKTFYHFHQLKEFFLANLLKIQIFKYYFLKQKILLKYFLIDLIHPYLSKEHHEISFHRKSNLCSKYHIWQNKFFVIKFKEPYIKDFQHKILIIMNYNYQHIQQIQNQLF